MIIALSQLIQAIEDFAPLTLQEEWDNSGLICGNPNAQISGLMLAFDCTEDVIMEAVACGANVVVTHHPLVFKGLRKIDVSNPACAALVAAIKNDIAVYACHTTADKAASGVSWLMAARLGLTGCRCLEEGGQGGLGVVGNLPEPMNALDFASKVKQAFACQLVRISEPLNIPIERVAVCGGSGASLIPLAMRSGAQAYVTGDISYHNFFTPEGFMVLDIGHYESEVDIVNALFDIITKKFPNFAVHTAKSKRNPVYYL